jgi:hypothetical protein
MTTCLIRSGWPLAIMVGLSLAAGTSQLSAETYHVDGDNCDDPSPDGSCEHPFCTIPQGLNAAAEGDTVLVRKIDGWVCGVPVGPEEWGSYLLTSSVTVAVGETLALEAGVVVKFKYYTNSDANPSLVVNGTLDAVGDPGGAENSVYFTSERDDAVGGDTNGDGGATHPARGDWYHIALNSTSAALIEHAEVRYAGRYWWYSAGWHARSEEAILMNSASPTIRDTTLRDTYGDALECNLPSDPTLERLTFANNDINGLNVLGGTIAHDAVWCNPDVVYYLDSTVTVAEGAGLTICPDMVVKFAYYTNNDQNISINVNGTLHVEGTPDSPAILTSIRDDDAAVPDGTNGDTNNDGPSDGARGDWYHIALNSTSAALIEHAEVRYAGRYWWYSAGWHARSEEAILIDSASPEIDSLHFEQCWGYPIEFDLDSFPHLSRLSANGVDSQDTSAVHIVGGTMASGGTWTNAAIPYYLDASVTTSPGVALAIDPGALFKFKKADNVGLYANQGKLLVKGTAQEPVIFTSIYDDEVSGDTNNDGGATLPAAGDWGQISYGQSGPPNTGIAYAQIRYAGNGSGGSVIPAVATTDMSNVDVSHCEFYRNAGFAVSVGGFSQTSVHNSFFAYNASGVELAAAAPGSSVVNCTSYRDEIGIQTDNSVTAICNNLIAYFGNCGISAQGGAPDPACITHNCVFSPFGTAFCGMDDLCGQYGNICQQPMFVDFFNDDFRLSCDSPCIDAGDNVCVPLDKLDLDGDADTGEKTPYDLMGDPRFVDDPNTPDTGNPDPDFPDLPIVDMGAYEFQACDGDLDCDGDTDHSDLGILLADWGCTGGDCPGDLDGDGDTDHSDLGILLGNWGCGT